MLVGLLTAALLALGSAYTSNKGLRQWRCVQMLLEIRKPHCRARGKEVGAVKNKA
jgi:hypothetical protein